MLGKKGTLLVVALFIASVLFTGRARLVLDDLTASFRDTFQEMLYLPRGEGLKVLACGFDAPLADALFIKSLIFYAEAFAKSDDENFRAASRKYVFALFDVITDLSPRFTRAYQVGALFLTSSATERAVREGITLLEKGIRVADEEERAGRMIVPDGRWLFHTLLATTYEVGIQTFRNQAGDLQGASEARRMAGEEFRLAAASRDAPPYIIAAAAGYASRISGQADVEDSMVAVLSVWQFLREQAEARGDKEVAADLDERIGEMQSRVAAIRETRELEGILSRAGALYAGRGQGAPARAEDLVEAGLLNYVPPGPMGTEEEPDSWLVLPDGAFRSRLLSNAIVEHDLQVLLDAAVEFQRIHNRTLQSPEELVDGHFVDHIPEPPLYAIGQRYEFNPQFGTFSQYMPLVLKNTP